ncbi:MAG: caspase family protein [Scytolyngbya sp. HA4215-MV1]|jgi:hypothetical protein|nr:caspase family protein [Scytolyngbya sp. HA4215-MV1]
MSTLNRRHFLQAAGSTLAAIGLSQFDFLAQADRTARVLAQSTPRKLALLVGINDYPDPISSLAGCLTDVDLQRELLVHRFGFNPKDILVVSDKESLTPTRQNILTAFETHLIQQAKRGDVVVFHYSGHGSLVLDSSPQPLFKNDQGQGINGTIVPRDRVTANPTQVQDIMGHTLFLLMSALQTEDITAVLDSCHSGGGTRGNLVFRATPSRSSARLDDPQMATPSPEELAYQQHWLSRLQLTEATFHQKRSQIAKGVAIGSATYNQYAADAPFSGFTAGAFTYLLTRYLWQQTANESLERMFVNLSRSTKDVAYASGVEQDPIYEVNPQSNAQKPVYCLTHTTPAAEAVVTEVSKDNIQFWLGGVSSRSLDATGADAIFTLIDRSGKALGDIQLSDRQGLVGTGKLSQGNANAVQPGLFLRERVRGVPNDLKLRIGLDRSLGKNRSAAQTGLKALSRIAATLVEPHIPVDYILGRLTPEALSHAQHLKVSDLPSVGSVGLFTAGLVPISATFGQPEETVEAAIARLRPRFKSLLAGRILQLAVGGESSEGLQVSTAVVPKGSSTAVTPHARQFKSGTEFQVKVRNHTDQNLHVAVLLIGSSGNLTVLYPYWDAPEDADLIAPQQELVTPQSGDGYQFILKGVGFLEVLVLASSRPLRNTLKAIQTIAKDRGIAARSPLPLKEDTSLDVVGALLGDLDRNARDADVEVKSSKQAVDTQQLAATSTILEVVP